MAERLRCSREKVKRLRLDGHLTYLKGTPVLVDEVDLVAFIERCKTGLVDGKIEGRRPVGSRYRPAKL